LVAQLETLLDKGRFEECIALTEQALAEGETGAHQCLLSAQALAATGRVEEAAEAYGRVLALDPGNAEARAGKLKVLEDMVEFYEQVGPAEAALCAYKRYLDLVPDSERMWVNMGLCFLRLEPPRAQMALERFHNALRLNPQSELAWYNIGVLHFELDSYRRAIEAFNRCLAINPSSSAAWFYKGLSLVNVERRALLGQFLYRPRALDCFRRALAIDPQHEGALEALRQFGRSQGA
jgi:tetratricopeptide (TPR) repeat protein